MNSLYTAGVRQTTAIQGDLERMRAGESSASLLGQISASLAALNRTVDDYDSMAKREMIKSKQEKAVMRVQKFRADYVELKKQFDRLKTDSANEKAAAQRTDLFATSNSLSSSSAEPRRRWGPGPSSPSPHSESPFRGPTPVPAAMPNAGLREAHALDEHTFLQSTETRLDEFIAQGQDVLNNLVDQRNVLKGTQRRLLDAANTLGLSRDVIGWIERRSRQDMYIFFGGAVFTFFCFYWIWQWFG